MPPESPSISYRARCFPSTEQNWNPPGPDRSRPLGDHLGDVAGLGALDAGPNLPGDNRGRVAGGCPASPLQRERLGRAGRVFPHL